MDIKLSDQTAAFRLFNYYYLCRMPAAERMNVNDHEYYGIPTTMNRSWDAALASHMDYQQLTPAEMASLAAEGVRLEIHDPADAVKIYKDINIHMQDWCTHLGNAFKPYEPPLEGLKEFNQLAKLLIMIARGHGLVNALERQDRRVAERAFRGESYSRRTPNLANITHGDVTFNNILDLAGRAGYSIRKYQLNGELLTSAREPEQQSILFKGSI